MNKTDRACIILMILIGALATSCTFIAFTTGNVNIVDKDSHNAVGTNHARAIDLNISPR
jgi:hypothetical protein